MNNLRTLRNVALNALVPAVLSITGAQASDETRNSVWTIIHTNNWTTTWWPNDLWPTWDLEISYENYLKQYKINAYWSIYVNWSTNNPKTKRTDPDNLRTDSFHVEYLQWWNNFWLDGLKYWPGIEVIWNLWWADVQNWIHSAVWDSYIPAKYLSWYTVTPTFNFEYEKEIFNYLELNAKWKIPLILDNWIVEFSAMVSKSTWDILETWIYWELWLGVDCKIYPDRPEFSWFPLGDFRTCTPEVKTTIWYWDTSVFVKIPLTNNNVQNSIFWIEYKF